MNCSNCAAPLPATSMICAHCGTLNDTDLRALHRNARQGPPSERLCPRCEVAMQTVDLQVGGTFLIERCDRCLGIFFDLNELGALLKHSTKDVHDIDHQRMSQVIEQERKATPYTDLKTYVKCPVCRKTMNRRSAGARSGVIADRCKDHGTWLDGGELGLLLKWAKAGGQLHSEKRKLEEQKREMRERARKRQSDATGPVIGDARYDWHHRDNSAISLLDVVSWILR